MGIKGNMEASARDLRILISRGLTLNKTRRNPRYRFRSAIRAVINNLKWLQDDKLAETSIEEAYNNTMRSKYKQCIPNILKGFLKTSVSGRTDEEKEMIYNVVGHIKSLQVYPVEVKRNLLGVASFVYYQPQKLLCREGDPAYATYFILSGKINVYKNVYDPGEMKVVPVLRRALGPNESYGEANVLHRMPWHHTYTSATHVELLSIRYYYFSDIVNTFLKSQGPEVQRCLREFEYFKHFTDQDKRNCSIIARIEVYSANEVILGENIGNHQVAYFLLAGECTLVHELKVGYTDRNGKDVSVLLDSDSTNAPGTSETSQLIKGIIKVPPVRPRRPIIAELVVETTLDGLVEHLPYVQMGCKSGNYEEVTISETHFMQVGVLGPGACFGLGENYDSTFVTSSRTSGVRLMTIPRYFLLKRNKGNIWGLTKAYLNCHLPSRNTIFQKFRTGRKWNSFKNRHFQSIAKDTMPPGATACDVPYNTRLSEDLNHPYFVRRKREVQIICPPTELIMGPEWGAESVSSVNFGYGGHSYI